ncbi:protein BFR2 [Drosophila serrata]|uniref:protein BFR2 n=1 Tax=Drosophila serrata TaxID=7274 RepID=UPI000A1D0FB6|nr:protein BFR2 [Drosophila serrata]
MSCICEFHTPGVDSPKDLTPLPLPTNDDDSSIAVSPKGAEPEECSQESGASSAVSASELADCRAENWLLKKKLREYEVTIENLEHLVSTLVEKQHQILSDMFNLRTENHELQSECHLQREYHSMERNALLKQLNDAQVLYQNQATTLKSRPNKRESPNNSGSSFVASSDNEDQGESGSDSNDDQESNSDEENDDLSADSLAPSSEGSSPTPTCSESEDTDLEDDQSGENTTNTNSETD